MNQIKYSKGHIEMGTPFIILAILGAVAVPAYWESMPTWVRIIAVSTISIFAIIGLVIMFSDQGGMGTNALINEQKDLDE